MFDNVLKKVKDTIFGAKPTVLKNILFNEKKSISFANPPSSRPQVTPTPIAKPTAVPTKKINTPTIAPKITMANKLATDIIQNKQPGIVRNNYGSSQQTASKAVLGTKISPTGVPMARATATPTPTVPTPTPPPDNKALPYYQMINEAAAKYKVPQKTLYNLLRTESMGFNPAVISGRLNSPVGAQGIAQFMPATAAGVGVDPLDPPAAIEASAKYLSRKYLEHGKDWRLALAAYNAGSGNVRKYGGVPPFPETQGYIKRILGEEE